MEQEWVIYSESVTLDFFKMCATFLPSLCFGLAGVLFLPDFRIQNVYVLWCLRWVLEAAPTRSSFVWWKEWYLIKKSNNEGCSLCNFFCPPCNSFFFPWGLNAFVSTPIVGILYSEKPSFAHKHSLWGAKLTSVEHHCEDLPGDMTCVRFHISMLHVVQS